MNNDKISGTRLTKEEASRVFLQNIEYVCSTAARFAPSQELQADITHDAYVYFIEKAQTWIYDPDRIKPLLKVITRNMANRYWTQYTRSLPENMRKLAEQLQETANRYDQDLMISRSQELAALRICLEKLSPSDRQIVELYYFGKIGYSELIIRMGKSRDAVYKIMSRLRGRLHDCIEKTLQGNDPLPDFDRDEEDDYE